MEYYLYCWLALPKLASKCKVEEKQEEKLPELAAKLAPDERPIVNVSTEGYVLIVAVCVILMLVGQIWFKRFKGRGKNVCGDVDGSGERTPQRRPRRPPRSSDESYLEEV